MKRRAFFSTLAALCVAPVVPASKAVVGAPIGYATGGLVGSIIGPSDVERMRCGFMSVNEARAKLSWPGAEIYPIDPCTYRQVE